MMDSFSPEADAQTFIPYSGSVHLFLHLCWCSRIVLLCHALCTPGTQQDARIFIYHPSLFRGVCFAKHANQNVDSH